MDLGVHLSNGDQSIHTVLFTLQRQPFLFVNMDNFVTKQRYLISSIDTQRIYSTLYFLVAKV